ncbi:hypothetical protein HWV62_16084 [Athelia sp. TMB]|nr:hypothetical protein HWV62_16084 [Athelia sp. TMB]
MRSDPRVIRWTMLKLGERIEDVVKPMEATTNRTLEPANQVGAGFGDGMGKGLGHDRYGVTDALEDAMILGVGVMDWKYWMVIYGSLCNINYCNAALKD